MDKMLSIARAFIESQAKVVRTIYDREGGSPYLSRIYLSGVPYRPVTDGENCDQPSSSAPWDAMGNPYPDTVFPPGGIYLHRFHRSDVDWMHNHPWEWAFSLVLEHGYVEHRLGKESRLLKPGDVNLITHDDFHLVNLLRDSEGKEREATTLFVVGPKTKHWGFWDAQRGVVVPWREYIAASRSPDGLAGLRK